MLKCQQIVYIKEVIMTIDEVKQYFGSDYKVCQALGIERQNFTVWRKKGVIPPIHQLKLQELSNGELTARINDTRSYGAKDE